MRVPTRARARTVVAWGLLVAGGLATGGCATLRATIGGYVTGPRGISRAQQRLRNDLSRGDYKAALAWHEDDALLQRLDVGIASYYAAQYQRSAAEMDTAALIADDRITASLSKDALALVTNDMARPYQPRRTERLFIPYYAMLAYARLDQWEDAAVEARRLVALLEQYADDRGNGERALHASLHELAGGVFERAGEHDDAQVAYRAALALRPARLVDDRQRPPAGTGELLVVVERGFVAHLVTETLRIRLGDDRDMPREARGEQVAVLREAVAPSGGWGPSGASATTASTPVHDSPPRHPHGDDDTEWLTIAFPALRPSPRPWGGAVRLTVDDTLERDGIAARVDDARTADESRERISIVARAAARATAKLAVTKAIEDRKGEVAGTLAEIGASLLERADVRSWHLLPQELTLMRIRLPAGPHEVRLRVGEGSAARTVEVGTITVRTGTLSIAPVRLWRAPPPPAAPSYSPWP
jgi:tetratricopeptide (TPR) repeat protein